MILLQLLKHSKNTNWYCIFRNGKCFIRYLPKDWMHYWYVTSVYSCKSKNPIEQYEKVGSLLEAIKYKNLYNERK